MTVQESPANAKWNMRQQCMFEGPLRTKFKLKDLSSWFSTRQLWRPASIAFHFTHQRV